MFGISETIIGAIIGAAAGFMGLLIGLLVNTFLESKRAQRERLKDIRGRLLGERLLAFEVIEFVESQKKRRLRIISWTKVNDWMSDQIRKYSRKHEKEVGQYKLSFSSAVDVISERIFHEIYKFFSRHFYRFMSEDEKQIEKHRPTLGWAKLQGIHLRLQELNDVIFFNTDLTDANLTHANLRNTIFQSAHLNKSNLSQADLKNAFFEKTDMSEIFMEATDLRKVYFTNTNICKANLNSSKFFDSLMSECDLSHCSLKDGAFEETRVNESNLENVDFTHAHIYNCHFENLRAKEAIFINSELHKTYFVDADLSKTDFTGASFNDIFMIGVNLRGAKLNPDQLNLITFGKQIILPNGRKKYFAPEIVKEDGYILTKYAGKIAYKVFDFRDSFGKLKI